MLNRLPRPKSNRSDACINETLPAETRSKKSWAGPGVLPDDVGDQPKIGADDPVSDRAGLPE